MLNKKLIRAFIAGMAFPAVFLPLAYSFLSLISPRHLIGHPVQFITMYLPLFWGLANCIFVIYLHGSSNKIINQGLWMTGIGLGFVVAIFGVFFMRLPTMLFGIMNEFMFAPLIILPIVYGLVFRYVVKWLNKLVGL